jgi:multiple sugar transport system permease protein
MTLSSSTDVARSNVVDASRQSAKARRLGQIVQGTGWHIVLSAIGLVLLAPLAWLLLTSLKEPSQIFVLPPVWIPSTVSWQNYPEALTAQPF